MSYRHAPPNVNVELLLKLKRQGHPEKYPDCALCTSRYAPEKRGQRRIEDMFPESLWNLYIGNRT